METIRVTGDTDLVALSLRRRNQFGADWRITATRNTTTNRLMMLGAVMMGPMYNSLADTLVLFVFFGLGLLLAIRSGEGGEDMDVNGGDGDDDRCGIFFIRLM